MVITCPLYQDMHFIVIIVYVCICNELIDAATGINVNAI